MTYDNIIFLDTETTGFDGSKDRIIELAFIVKTWGNYVEIDDFIRLPEGAVIPEKIVELTGITERLLEINGMDEEIAARVLGFSMKSGRTLIVAHNAQFDLDFVRGMFARHSEKHPELLEALSRCDYLDTLTVFKDRRPGPHKLSDAIKAYYLEGKVYNTHRALDDCRALLEVFASMIKERDDLESYVNVFGYYSKYGIQGYRHEKVRYHVQDPKDYMATPEETLPAIIKREGDSHDR
ncbi:MAG: 3'-5' exonuclease [Clostridiales bacterium]|nr:3'-5' exonuclease [Clostridiales bacterium]